MPVLDANFSRPPITDVASLLHNAEPLCFLTHLFMVWRSFGSNLRHHHILAARADAPVNSRISSCSNHMRAVLCDFT